MSHTYYAPFTGFGDDPNTSVKFGILFVGDEFPQWESEAVRSTFDMALPTTGGIQRVSQMMGRLPWTVSWTVWLKSLDDYAYMDAFVNNMATLRYTWGTTAKLDGYLENIVGQDYLVLPDTILVSLTSPVIAVDGKVEATATFERSASPHSYYGIARYAEDEE